MGRRIEVRIEQYLSEAVTVTQINEYQFPQVTAAVDPAGQTNGLTGMAGC